LRKKRVGGASTEKGKKNTQGGRLLPIGGRRGWGEKDTGRTRNPKSNKSLQGGRTVVLPLIKGIKRSQRGTSVPANKSGGERGKVKHPAPNWGKRKVPPPQEKGIFHSTCPDKAQWSEN